MPGPTSATATASARSSESMVTVTGGDPCSRALPTRLPITASRRRRSAQVWAGPEASTRTFPVHPPTHPHRPHHQRAQLDLLPPHVGDAGVEPGDLHEVLDEGRQPA